MSELKIKNCVKNSQKLLNIYAIKNNYFFGVYITNIADRTQYYSSEFKKMRCEIRDCGKY